MGHPTVWSECEWSPKAVENAPKSYQFWRRFVRRRIPGWAAYCSVIIFLFCDYSTPLLFKAESACSFFINEHFFVHRASNDNIRLWNANEAGEKEAPGRGRSGVPFKIIPGHHGGIISQMGA